MIRMKIYLPLLITAGILTIPTAVPGQANPFSDALLTKARAADFTTP